MDINFNLKVLEKAIKALPSLIYALGFVGLVAAFTASMSFSNPAISIVGGILMIIPMIMIFLFSKLISTDSSLFKFLYSILAAFSVLFFIAIAITVFSSIVFDYPKKPRDLFMLDSGHSTVLSKARSGDSDAQYTIGLWYQYGLNGFDVDINEAIMWYSMASQSGSILATDALDNLKNK